jgi:hypothetical protein
VADGNFSIVPSSIFGDGLNEEITMSTRPNSGLRTALLSCFLDELGNPRRELQAKCSLSRGGAHLAPRLLNDSEKLVSRVVRMLDSETRDLVLQKNEACGIFKQLSVGIRLQSGLGNPCSRIFGLSRLGACLEEQFASALRLSAVEAFSPREISGSVRRIRIARNTPALEMLASRRQAKKLRGAWRETNEPRLDSVRVDELSRPSVEALGIARMSGVDELTRTCIEIHVGILKTSCGRDRRRFGAQRH